MHAAVPDTTCSEVMSAVAASLPRSNCTVQPDRGDWEYLQLAVGIMRVRPIDAPLAPAFLPAGASCPTA